MVKNVLEVPRAWSPRKVQWPRITSQTRPGRHLRLGAYSRALLSRQNLTSVGELLCSRQSSCLPRQVTTSDCTSCSFVDVKASLVEGVAGIGELCRSPKLCRRRRRPSCLRTRCDWKPEALSRLFPAMKVAGRKRSFMMRDFVDSRHSVVILSLVICTK